MCCEKRRYLTIPYDGWGRQTRRIRYRKVGKVDEVDEVGEDGEVGEVGGSISRKQKEKKEDAVRGTCRYYFPARALGRGGYRSWDWAGLSK